MNLIAVIVSLTVVEGNVNVIGEVEFADIFSDLNVRSSEATTFLNVPPFSTVPTNAQFSCVVLNGSGRSFIFHFADDGSGESASNTICEFQSA